MSKILEENPSLREFIFYLVKIIREHPPEYTVDARKMYDRILKDLMILEPVKPILITKEQYESWTRQKQG